jgi:AcrR family transcriptional regulator
MSTLGLRERKRARTREAIQREALRLFHENGYEATTVEDVAAAADVSHMTFYRHFPTKEDVVFSDEYDALIFERIASRLPTEPAMEVIRAALLDGLSTIYDEARDELLVRARLIASTPALRARLWEQQLDTAEVFVTALAARSGDPSVTLGMRVVAAACAAAATTAVLVWAETERRPELPALMDEAFASLRDGLA